MNIWAVRSQRGVESTTSRLPSESLPQKAAALMTIWSQQHAGTGAVGDAHTVLVVMGHPAVLRQEGCRRMAVVVAVV